MNATPTSLGCACPTAAPAATSRLVQQFGRPTGWLGQIVGFAMAVKNRRRSRWVLSLLPVTPTDRVLEVGCGPGADLHRVSRLVTQGCVAGADHSEVMVKQARRRNRRAMRAGRVAVHLASATRLPGDDAAFDTVFSINCAQFWGDPAAALAEQRRVLRQGGTLAVAVQPRGRGAGVAAAEATGRWLVTALQQAGFRDVRLQMSADRPAPVACALGVK